MQLDFERYECKYVIPHDLMGPIESYIAPYTTPDPYMAASPTGDYMITTLYLDTPTLTFHYNKSRRTLNRLKLRIRTYDEKTEGAVFFEIKRKINDVVHKKRVLVDDPDWVAKLEEGYNFLGPSATDRDRQALDEFLMLKEAYHAQPSTMVRYSREAFHSEIDDYARVTFDKRLRCQPPNGYYIERGQVGWNAIDDPAATTRMDSGIVLELKFNNFAPLWLTALVEHFQLRLRGFSKYSTSIEYLLDEYRYERDIRLPRPLYMSDRRRY